jgi:hypothetical protein
VKFVERLAPITSLLVNEGTLYIPMKLKKGKSFLTISQDDVVIGVMVLTV